MFKRVTWFTVGMAAGAVGTTVAYLRARDLAREHVPDSMADAAGRIVRVADAGVRAAIDHGGERLDDWRANADATRRTRREAEILLRQQLEQAGL
jgi:hypothetical protein